ncbi:DNA primase [Prevotella sp.]|uniref:DNA primase n=1 Tax=uncultured Prevotella sp. TaxID=159272 RepID=UPI0027E2C76A|nr:CHC2 zinc finger domain-containing protein [Prevotella sp.]
MIRQETIDTILERTDIVALIGEHVHLRKCGTRYVGCCPFHNENTPSFYISPQTGRFKCFGCGEGGDAIHFIEKVENKTFIEAVKTLAQRANVEIEQEQESAEAKQKRLHKEALWIANKQVADFYRKQFLESKEAQAYAYRRWGKDYCTLKEIGYAPADGHALQLLPVKADFLKELGLLNRGGYDFYQNRIVIQIHDRFGHVIGFTARCMDEQQPKYLNSSDSLIFHKSTVLFGIEDAWKTAAKQDKMFLVEGAPDCMRLQSIGIYNTVTTLGSAWNETHFSTIKRIARCVSFRMLTHPRTENRMAMAYKSSWRQEHWLWKMVYPSASRKSRTRTTTKSRIRTRSSKTPISSTPPRRRTSFFGWLTNCFRRRTPRRSSD